MTKYVKPSLNTKFHIDFVWWQTQSSQQLKAHLQSHACPECRAQYQAETQPTFDWIDPDTGEIFQLDLLWHLIYTHCSRQPGFIEEHMPLATAIVRAYIAVNNKPLTPQELFEHIKQKTPAVILGTIGGHKVYNGIRPVVLSA
jgi:hypothetical protein